VRTIRAKRLVRLTGALPSREAASDREPTPAERDARVHALRNNLLPVEWLTARLQDEPELIWRLREDGSTRILECAIASVGTGFVVLFTYLDTECAHVIEMPSRGVAEACAAFVASSMTSGKVGRSWNAQRPAAVH